MWCVTWRYDVAQSLMWGKWARAERNPLSYPDIQQLSGSSGFGGTLIPAIVTLPAPTFSSSRPLPSSPGAPDTVGRLSLVEANVMRCIGVTDVVGNVVGGEWDVCFSLWAVGGGFEGEIAPWGGRGEGVSGEGRWPRCRGLAYFTVLLAITFEYLASYPCAQKRNIRTGIEIRRVLRGQGFFCCARWYSRFLVLDRRTASGAFVQVACAFQSTFHLLGEFFGGCIVARFRVSRCILLQLFLLLALCAFYFRARVPHHPHHGLS